MRKNKFYYLSSVKNYLLAQNYHNEDLKKYVKDVYFNNIFSMYKDLEVYDYNSCIIIDQDGFNKISLPILPLIRNYLPTVRIYNKPLPKTAIKLCNIDNKHILKNYTKNYTKNNSLKGSQNILRKAGLYKKHITNLKHIHSFNMILSFDFEYNSLCKEGVSEIGVSLYRPKENTFIHRHLLIKGKEATTGKKSTLQKLFNFGETEIVDRETAFNYLDDLINKADILLAHDIINELQILRIKPNWVKIIDTKICELIINPQDKYLSLMDSLKKHKMSSSYLHNAGNDAAYALQLALQMHNEITVSKKNN